MSNFSAIVAVRGSRTPIDTTKLFDTCYVESNDSPVDQFLSNTVSINRHWVVLPLDQEVDKTLGTLFLLGYVSAVESYMRSLIRRLVIIDKFSSMQCEPHQLSYGAVLHHEPSGLPDALLEETTFSVHKAIPNALQKFVGMQNISSGTTSLLHEFDRICQLRHCCTHRFGKLGVKNALSLGLGVHSKFIDKPVLLGKAQLAEIADLSFNLVKSINNDVFAFVLKRTVVEKLSASAPIGIGWTWHKAQDKKLFKPYYETFRSLRDATPSEPMDVVYDLFRDEYHKVGGGSAPKTVQLKAKRRRNKK